MTAIKQFIEDAIKGGWGLFGHAVYKERTWQLINSSDGVGHGGDDCPRFGKSAFRIEITIPPVHRMKERYSLFDVEKALLDPLAWQAVGKTRGWLEHYDHLGKERDWHGQWHQFVSYLANGLSIEEALAKLV